MEVGRLPRRAEMTDAELGLRGAGPIDNQQPRRGSRRNRCVCQAIGPGSRLGLSGGFAPPVPERLLGIPRDRGAVQRADGDERRARGLVPRAMERRDVAGAHAGQRGARPDGEMPVRVRAVERPREHGLRVDAGQILELPDAVDAQRAHAIEIGRAEPRADDDVGQDAQALRHEALEQRDRQHHRVGPGFRVEFGPDPRQFLLHRDRRPIAGPLVEHVCRHRREARPFRRVSGAAGGQQEREAHHRQAATLHGGEREAVRQALPVRRREREARVGARARKPAAIDRAHVITTCSEPGAARPGWPAGTALIATQQDGSRCAAAAARMLPALARR